MNEHEIIDEQMCIVYRLVLIGKTRYSIVGTGWDLGHKDVLINLDTGKRKSFTRKDLKELLIKYKAVKIK